MQVIDDKLDYYNWQTLMIEGAIAINLGLFFYYIPHMRDNQRKKFWSKQALDSLKQIKAEHELIISDYSNYVKGNSISVVNAINAPAYLSNVYIPDLTHALEQIGELLKDQALYKAIIDLVKKPYFSHKLNTFSDNPNPETEDVQKRIDRIKEDIQTLEGLMDRLQNEIPRHV